jgi:hypothetical protein
VVQIGFLDPGETYTVEVEGAYREALSDANGSISVDVNLAERRTLRVTPGPPPENAEPTEPGEPSADAPDASVDGAVDGAADPATEEGEPGGGGGGCSCAVID